MKLAMLLIVIMCILFVMAACVLMLLYAKDLKEGKERAQRIIAKRKQKTTFVNENDEKYLENLDKIVLDKETFIASKNATYSKMFINDIPNAIIAKTDVICFNGYIYQYDRDNSELLSANAILALNDKIIREDKFFIKNNAPLNETRLDKASIHMNEVIYDGVSKNNSLKRLQKIMNHRIVITFDARAFDNTLKSEYFREKLLKPNYHMISLKEVCKNLFKLKNDESSDVSLICQKLNLSVDKNSLKNINYSCKVYHAMWYRIIDILKDKKIVNYYQLLELEKAA